MSGNEQVDDSSMDSSPSIEIFLDQAENSAGTESENPSSAGNPQHLPFRIMLKPSCDLSNPSSAPSSPAHNTNQPDLASSSRYSISLKDLQKSLRTLTPGQIGKAISHKKSDVGGAKIDQRDLSPFAANRNADFSTPPQCSPVPEIRSYSKRLTGTSTPSPDKRSIETDLETTAIKRFRKTPESNSDKPEALAESCGSNTSISVAEEASRKSPAYLQIQQSIKKNEESKLLHTPSVPGKRKKNILDSISDDYDADNNPCSSESISPFSTANIHESSANLQMHGSEVDKSDSGAETLTPIRDRLADSKSLGKLPNPDGLLQIACSLAWASATYTSVDASSVNPDIKVEKQTDAHGCVLPHFTSKDAVMHPTTITDTSIGPNKVTGKERDKHSDSDFSFKVQSDSPENETQSVVHPLGLADKISSLNRELASKSQNSISEGFESRMGEYATQDSASVSSKETPNPGDSAIKTQLLKSPLSCPIILNPDLPSTRLPQRSDSATSNVSHRALEFDVVKKEITTRGKFNSSTPYRGSRPQSKEFSVFGKRRKHCKSLSEETPRNRNSAEAEPSSASQGYLPRVNAEESLPPPPPSLGMDRRFGNCGMFRNLPGDEALQSFLRLLLNLKYAAVNIPVVPIDSARKIDKCLRLICGLGPRNESQSSDEPATARNNQDVQMRRKNLNESLMVEKINMPCSPSTLHYSHPPVVGSDRNPPYIDVVEGQATTSRYQPTFEVDFNLDHFSALIDGVQCLENHDRIHGVPESSASSSSSSTSSLYDNHPEYVVNALTLLQSVLKEMMMYNGDEEPWRTCEPLFRRFFESRSKLARMRLHSTLMLYLANRGYGLWTRNLFTSQEVTAEALMLINHEKLILTVITIIGAVLTRRSIGFTTAYSGFKELQSFFTQYWHDNRVEDIQNEVSRKQALFLKEMIQRFMLVTRMAMQLVLMHMGENYDEDLIRMISRDLSEEDKMYLRRRV